MSPSSFFDDEESAVQNNGFWQSDNPKKRIKDSKFAKNPQKYFRGPVFKHDKKTGEYKTLIFVLVDNRLSYIKVGLEEGYILLDNHGLELFDNKDSASYPFGLRLIKNRKYTEFYLDTKENRETWLSRLQRSCVFNHFFNDFSASNILGKGNFAKVYRVQSRTVDKEYAAKVFEKKELQKAAKFRKTLLSEIKIMRMLDHPYMMKLHQVYEGEEHVYLLFDLLKGKELFQRVVQRTRYSEKNAALVMKRLMEAMGYLQSKGILHRDIKLENVLLEAEEDDCSVCLGDFGLAMLMSEYDPKVRCGTPGYVAPEVLNNQHYAYKSDIFSLGAALFILLSGSAPFPGKTFDEIVTKNKKCDLKFNPKYWDKVSPEAIDLVKRMMNPNPSDRPTWKEVLENEWIIKMTQDGGHERPLDIPNLDESSKFLEIVSCELENNKDDDSPEKENYLAPQRFGSPNCSQQSFNGTINLNEDKLNSQIKSGDSTKFVDKSFEKKQSINFLAVSDGSRLGINSQRPSKYNATNLNRSAISKSKVLSNGLEQGMPSLNIPFNNNDLSNDQLNSFYRKATMLKSFNRGNTLFTAFRDRDDGKIHPEKSSEFDRKKTMADDTTCKMDVDNKFTKTFLPKRSENLVSELIAEFHLQKHTVSDKIKTLNHKNYSFAPSKIMHEKNKKKLP